MPGWCVIHITSGRWLRNLFFNELIKLILFIVCWMRTFVANNIEIASGAVARPRDLFQSNLNILRCSQTARDFTDCTYSYRLLCCNWIWIWCKFFGCFKIQFDLCLPYLNDIPWQREQQFVFWSVTISFHNEYAILWTRMKKRILEKCNAF